MGGCFGKGLTKTEMAIVEARALQKHDHDVNEVNLLLDDPFPSHVWDEITSLLRLPHNRQQIELLQVRVTSSFIYLFLVIFVNHLFQ